MKLDSTWDWTELAEGLVEGQEAMQKAGFDMGGHTIEGHATPLPSKHPDEKGIGVQEWLKLDNLRNTVASQDDLMRELMTRQDRQAKWIIFLLASWVFAGVFLALATLAR